MKMMKFIMEGFLTELIDVKTKANRLYFLKLGRPENSRDVKVRKNSNIHIIMPVD